MCMLVVHKKNLELILKVFTQVCFEEENTKFTPVAYLVASLKVLLNSNFSITQKKYKPVNMHSEM